MTLAYHVGTSGETVVIADEVLDHLARHRQMRWWQREAGGLLFAEVTGPVITVALATGPQRRDLRSRFAFSTSLTRQQPVVDAQFELGRHYVGEWHTHPEPLPSPSGRDQLTMTSRVRESRHALAGFLFAIIGQAPLPDGLTLMLHDGERAHRLMPT